MSEYRVDAHDLYLAIKRAGPFLTRRAIFLVPAFTDAQLAAPAIQCAQLVAEWQVPLAELRCPSQGLLPALCSVMRGAGPTPSRSRDPTLCSWTSLPVLRTMTSPSKVDCLSGEEKYVEVKKMICLTECLWPT
jgi:hypothetical protein